MPDRVKEKLAHLIVSDLPEKDQIANAEAAGKLADHLIAHGVTVQEWISVKDRLPEAGTKALCYLKRGEYWTAVWDDCGDDLWSDGEAWCSNGEVTHWMPLPQPPKGE
jgi:hypothetical protein